VRLILPIAAVLALGACDVDNDPANEQVTVNYDREKIREAGRTAKDVASSVGNVAESTGKAIKKEVGDVDVDVSVRRNREVEPAAVPTRQ
jgi:hypothetical protein